MKRKPRAITGVKENLGEWYTKITFHGYELPAIIKESDKLPDPNWNPIKTKKIKNKGRKR